MNRMPSDPRRPATETGSMPPVDVEPDAPHEPSRPPSLPEFEDDSGSITGRVLFASEGEDEAKESDDSTSASVH